MRALRRTAVLAGRHPRAVVVLVGDDNVSASSVTGRVAET